MNSATHIEATPDGINTMICNSEGGYQHTKLVGYSSVIRYLDSGKCDNDLPEGLRTIATIQDAVRLGYFTPTGEQTAILWRWIVSALFIIEQRQANGSVEVDNEDGGTERATIYQGECGGIAVYPATERLSLANHVEGLALEKYGADKGYPIAVNIYQTMVEALPGAGLRLSDEGRKGLAILHDGFIDMLNTEGMPAAPVAH